LGHRRDEFIVIEDMIESAKIMVLSMHTLLYPAG